MGLFFLDTSALVKRYVSETGHAWVVHLCDPAQGYDLHIAQATLVEVVATLCRKARESAITPAGRDGLNADFRRDTTGAYLTLPLPEGLTFTHILTG